MKKLFLSLFLFYSLGNACATDHFNLHWSNHTQNTNGNGTTGEDEISVLGVIGDSVTLWVYECCGSYTLYGPWYFNGDTVPATFSTNSIDIVITQTGFYSVPGNVAPTYYFNVCPSPFPPPPPQNFFCLTSVAGQVCPPDTCYCMAFSTPTLCATGYTWVLPQGITVLNNYGSSLYLLFTTAFAGDTLRVRANNSYGNSTEKKLYIGLCGITEIQSNSISSPGFNIFPNPAGDQLTVSAQPFITSSYELSVTDLSGRMIFQKKLNPEPQILNINLPNGMYIVRAYTNTGVFQQKLQISHR